MKVYPGRIQIICKDIVEALMSESLIEVVPEMIEEVELDIASILKEYNRMDREITDRARDVIAERELPYSHLFKVKMRLSGERGFGIGDDAVDYLSSQVIEMLLHTAHVDEVFGEDNDLRRKMRPVFRRQMAVDSDLDVEVRNKIKNLQEGSSDWEIEYRKVMGEMKDAKNLS